MLGELTDLGPFFAIRAHPRGTPPVPPWRPVTELTGPSRVLRARIESVRAVLATRGGLAATDVEPRAAASAVHLGMVARMTAPALGAVVLGCPLDLRPNGLWWQDVIGGPVPLSVPLLADGRAPADGPVTADWDRRLLEELVAPFTAAVAGESRVSGRVLWGNVASAVNSAAAQVAARRPDLAPAAWQAAGRLFASPLLRTERHPPGPAFRRSSCCLCYRLAPGTPAAVCGDCVLATVRQPDCES